VQCTAGKNADAAHGGLDACASDCGVGLGGLCAGPKDGNEYKEWPGFQDFKPSHDKRSVHLIELEAHSRHEAAGFMVRLKMMLEDFGFPHFGRIPRSGSHDYGRHGDFRSK
jgi:hypothetical protein